MVKKLTDAAVIMLVVWITASMIDCMTGTYGSIAQWNALMVLVQCIEAL